MNWTINVIFSSLSVVFLSKLLLSAKFRISEDGPDHSTVFKGLYYFGLAAIAVSAVILLIQTYG